MAVASAGPYASLHLAPDREPRQHPTTQFFPTEITRNCKQHGSVAKPAGCMHIPVFWGPPIHPLPVMEKFGMQDCSYAFLFPAKVYRTWCIMSPLLERPQISF